MERSDCEFRACHPRFGDNQIEDGERNSMNAQIDVIETIGRASELIQTKPIGSCDVVPARFDGCIAPALEEEN